MNLLFEMQLFSQIIQSGSLSAAGRHFGISPASVWRHLNALETSMGAKLIDRTSRKIALTEAGEICRRRLEKVTADVIDLSREIRDLQVSARGTVRVVCRASLASRFVVPTLPGFLRKYPDIRVDLRITDAEVDPLSDNADILIALGRVRNSSLLIRRILMSERIVCASPGYLKLHGEPNAPEDLQRHNCLIFSHENSPSIWRFKRNDKVTRIGVQGNLQANSSDALRAAAVDGLGFALLPKWCVSDQLENGQLRQVFQDYSATPFGFDANIYLVTRQSNKRPLPLKLVLNYLADAFKK
jgi:DNA-binding transcriptional LysR family regulator